MVSIKLIIASVAAFDVVISSAPTVNSCPQSHPRTSTTTQSCLTITEALYELYPTLPSISEIIHNFTVSWPSLLLPLSYHDIEETVSPVMRVSLWSYPHNLTSTETEKLPYPLLPFPRTSNGFESVRMLYKQALQDLKEYLHPEAAITSSYNHRREKNLIIERRKYASKLKHYFANVFCGKSTTREYECSEFRIINGLYAEPYSTREPDYIDLRDFPRTGASILLGVDLVNTIGDLDRNGFFREREDEEWDKNDVDDLKDLVSDIGYDGRNYFRDGVLRPACDTECHRGNEKRELTGESLEDIEGEIKEDEVVVDGNASIDPGNSEENDEGEVPTEQYISEEAPDEELNGEEISAQDENSEGPEDIEGEETNYRDVGNRDESLIVPIENGNEGELKNYKEKASTGNDNKNAKGLTRNPWGYPTPPDWGEFTERLCTEAPAYKRWFYTVFAYWPFMEKGCMKRK